MMESIGTFSDLWHNPSVYRVMPYMPVVFLVLISQLTVQVAV